MSAVPNASEAAGLVAPARPPRDLPKTAAEALRTFFSFASPRILLLLSAGTLAARLALGDWRWIDGLIPAALLAYWPLNEWLIHTQILHHRPRRIGPLRWDYRVARKHREHHRDPWHLPLVFIPLHIFWLAPPIIFALAFWLAPDAPRALTFLAAYFVLALHYEWCHYLAHIGWCPPLAYYRRRVREHRLHHFRNEKLWWGVSLGAADRWFGTAPDPDSVPRSPTTGTLGVSERV